jgi:hypothetical protein
MRSSPDSDRSTGRCKLAIPVSCVLGLVQLLWSLIVFEDGHVYTCPKVCPSWAVVPSACDLLVSS